MFSSRHFAGKSNDRGLDAPHKADADDRLVRRNVDNDVLSRWQHDVGWGVLVVGCDKLAFIPDIKSVAKLVVLIELFLVG